MKNIGILEAPYGIIPCRQKPYRRKLIIPERHRLMREPLPAEYGGTFADIRYDYFFKHVFGREENKELLIHFLNSFYTGRITITNVRYCPTHFLGEDPKTREIIYDVLCHTDNGRYFLLEMQRAYQDFFSRRMMHYGCKMIGHQVPAGKAGDNFALRQVNVISLLDFRLWEDTLLPAHLQEPYLRSADNTWTDTREPFNDVNWHFIQLPTFNKSLEALKTDLDRWIFLFRELGTLTERPPEFDHPVFKKIFQITDISKLNRKDREMFELTINGDRDWRNAISFAEREAREEGEKRGREHQSHLVVKNLIRNTDFDDQKIADLTSKSLDFVRSVRAGE